MEENPMDEGAVYIEVRCPKCLRTYEIRWSVYDTFIPEDPRLTCYSCREQEKGEG